MKIIRVFPRRTSFTPVDSLAFVGDPPMIRPEADEVHVSAVFTWDKARAEQLRDAWAQYYPVVKLGGPAFDDPCDDFTPGLYVRPGVTFTSRGCNHRCPFCLVPQREGRLREMEIHPGNIIQDNNLLQCNQAHIRKVFVMLRGQKAVQFSGGLDARLVTDEIASEIRSLRLNQVFLSCDTKEALKPLQRAIKRLALPRDKVRCYVLLRFDPNETIDQATERLLDVWLAGAIPFAQMFQPSTLKQIQYSSQWRRLVRLWSRPAGTKAIAKQLLDTTRPAAMRAMHNVHE